MSNILLNHSEKHNYPHLTHTTVNRRALPLKNVSFKHEEWLQKAPAQKHALYRLGMCFKMPFEIYITAYLSRPENALNWWGVGRAGWRGITGRHHGAEEETNRDQRESKRAVTFPSCGPGVAAFDRTRAWLCAFLSALLHLLCRCVYLS